MGRDRAYGSAGQQSIPQSLLSGPGDPGSREELGGRVAGVLVG